MGKVSYWFIRTFITDEVIKVTKMPIPFKKGYNVFTDTYNTRTGKTHRIKFILYKGYSYYGGLILCNNVLDKSQSMEIADLSKKFIQSFNNPRYKVIIHDEPDYTSFTLLIK